MKTIQTEIPEQLYKKAEALVKEGWFRDEKDIFSEAIRRFLDTHRAESMEQLESLLDPYVGNKGNLKRLYRL